jgi:hypothetical protein
MVRRREPPQASREQAVRHGEIRRLAHAILVGRHALAANRAQLQTIVDQIAPGLTERRGIGAVTAAQAIVSFSHPGRCRNDAAFAALSGTSPLQASSGKTVRHRLNRGGDRALNSAIHTIAITRIRCCPTTENYVARRTAEGKSSREIGASSATSPASSTAPSTPAPPSPPRHWQPRRPLDKHRSVRRSGVRIPPDAPAYLARAGRGLTHPDPSHRSIPMTATLLRTRALSRPTDPAATSYLVEVRNDGPAAAAPD